MSVVQRFKLCKTERSCRIETSLNTIFCSLLMADQRSVVRISVQPRHSARILLEKVTIDDSHNLIEYPIEVPLAGASAFFSFSESEAFCKKRKLDADTTFKSFETYLVVLDGVKYEYPIRGWIHYRSLN